MRQESGDREEEGGRGSTEFYTLGNKGRKLTQRSKNIRKKKRKKVKLKQRSGEKEKKEGQGNTGH